MSTRRIVTRSAVVAIGVLASLALMAAPSWAAKGGNSANAKLCEPGGYPGVLFNQQGEGFKNAGACTKYAAKGGQIAGADVVAQPAVGGSFKTTCSGFGLAPGFGSSCGAFYGTAPIGLDEGGVNAADGTVSFSVTFPCSHEGQKVSELDLVVVPAQETETLVTRFFPPPSGC
jgi:hypothetical protein